MGVVSRSHALTFHDHGAGCVEGCIDPFDLKVDVPWAQEGERGGSM